MRLQTLAWGRPLIVQDTAVAFWPMFYTTSRVTIWHTKVRVYGRCVSDHNLKREFPAT